MPILQFTDAQYCDLAAANGISDLRGRAELEHWGRELRRVHRLLAIDNYLLNQLQEYEQNLANCFTGLTLTSIPEVTNAEFSPVRREAFEVEQTPERPKSDTPKAIVARRVRDGIHQPTRDAKPQAVRELCPHIDSYFYWQIAQGFPEAWHREKSKLFSEKYSPEEIEQKTRALWEADPDKPKTATWRPVAEGEKPETMVKPFEQVKFQYEEKLREQWFETGQI